MPRRLIVALVLLVPVSADATVVFNWPNGGWTTGAPLPGQTVNQNFTHFSPNDITVSINNNGMSGSGGTWTAGYPQIDTTTSTGGFTGIDGLQLFLIDQSSVTSYIRTTVSFANPVTNVTFQLWDVDALDKQFADKIFNIQAVASGGGTVGPSSVTHPAAGYNTITGTGLGTVVLGIATADNLTSQGTIDITFTGAITQFSFDWANDDSKLGAQAIALGPIAYAPEVFPAWGSLLFCGLAVATLEIRRHRRRAPRRQAVTKTDESAKDR